MTKFEGTGSKPRAGVMRALALPSTIRIAVIDDDPMFGIVMNRWASSEGVELVAFSFLDDLGFIGLLAHYDVIIVDYDLGAVTGRDVAASIAALWSDKPMIIISGRDRSREIRNCPGSVKAFLRKSMGYEKILAAALQTSATAQASGNRQGNVNTKAPAAP